MSGPEIVIYNVGTKRTNVAIPANGTTVSGDPYYRPEYPDFTSDGMHIIFMAGGYACTGDVYRATLDGSSVELLGGGSCSACEVSVRQAAAVPDDSLNQYTAVWTDCNGTGGTDYGIVGTNYGGAAAYPDWQPVP
jgi:hypothetical protein